MDLRRVLWVERVGCRRLLALVEGLPLTSVSAPHMKAKDDKPKPSGGARAVMRRMMGR